MSLKSKMKSAVAAAEMTLAVCRNSGVVPESHRGMVLIEPTSVCNLSCPLCPTGTGTLKRENKYIDLKIVDKIIELTKPFAQGYILNLFGEPTFHPDFAAILEKTKHLPTWLSTNLSYGRVAVEELAKWEHLDIICSIDTVNAEEYPDYRVGGDYKKVLDNLRFLAKGACQVYPQFLVAEGAYDEAEYVAFAHEYGIPVQNVIIKTKLKEFRLDPTDKPIPGKCHSYYTGVYFNCDGYMIPCCNNVTEELYIQHVDDMNSVDDILRGAKAKEVRKALAKDKNMFASCGRCKGHNFWKSEFLEYIQCLKSLMPTKSCEEKPSKMS